MKQFSRFAERWRQQLIVAALAVAALVVALVLVPGGEQASGALAPPVRTTKPIPPRIVPYSPAGTPSARSSAGATSDPRSAHATPPRPSVYKRVRWTFDSGAAGWTGGDRAAATPARAPVLQGVGSLAVRNSSRQGQTVTASSGATAGTLTPARPGMRVFGTLAVRAHSAARNVHVAVAFLD